MYKCEICEKEYNNSQSFNAHKNKHKKEISLISITKTIERNALRKIESEKKYLINPKKCLYCDAIIPYEKRLNKFCSRTHFANYNNANRNFSDEKQTEINNKISKTTRKKPRNLSKECEECNCNFITNQKISQRYCSQKCARLANGRKNNKIRTEEYKKEISKRVLEQYKNGKQVFGGKTKWYNYKNIKVQGTYELRACYILDNFMENKVIKSWEYTNDRIPYIKNTGKEATYLLDFKVERLDGTFFYIETKGFERENDQLKWDAAKSQGFELIIWFKKDLELAEQNIYNPNLA